MQDIGAADILRRMRKEDCSTWLEIDLNAIAHNVGLLGQITGVQIMAVVKANAYGHGLIPCAQAALAGGANWLGVARLEEALLLRQAGICQPILVTSYVAPQRIPEAIQNQVSLNVYSPQQADKFSSAAVQSKQSLNVHAKIDSGMGRLGVFPEQGLAFLQHLNHLPGIVVEGVFTHLAMADEPEKLDTDIALQRFDQLVSSLTYSHLRPPLVHAANSAAALYFPQSRYDMVRCGISIYGLHPSDEAPLPENFIPALTWKARLQSVKELPAGHGVGYNARYVTNRIERIGAAAVGYADGFRRRLGNFALIHGQRVRMAGGICMDQCMLHLDAIPQARMGDELVLLGRQGSEHISAEEIARAWGTNNYEVVCGLAARIPRFYEGLDNDDIFHP